ncbi:chalcone isomerase family protein [Dechloromonas denitrificans]|uniref:chalcone isomerase family protein n=1 Tax=Dechloromonas denitrificans TaxID=281362 RepID=UPI001CF8EC9A|nr:chalcone isomerase family protein [Dechloromonas denitrificans]
MISHSVRVATLAAALLAIPGLHAAEVAGVTIDEKIKVGNSELVLNGAGLRSKVFIKVYVGALYVTQKSGSPAGLLDAPGARRMSLRLLRDIDSDTLYGALRDGLKDNNSETDLVALKSAIDQFAEIMKKIGNARSGDTVAIDFTAEGVAVSFNGEVRGKVANVPFARALLKVWLGDHPVDASLKKALLGS